MASSCHPLPARRKASSPAVKAGALFFRSNRTLRGAMNGGYRHRPGSRSSASTRAQSSGPSSCSTPTALPDASPRRSATSGYRIRKVVVQHSGFAPAPPASTLSPGVAPLRRLSLGRARGVAPLRRTGSVSPITPNAGWDRQALLPHSCELAFPMADRHGAGRLPYPHPRNEWLISHTSFSSGSGCVLLSSSRRSRAVDVSKNAHW